MKTMRHLHCLLLIPLLCIAIQTRAQPPAKKHSSFADKVQLEDKDDSRFGLHAQGGRMLMAGYTLESFERFQQSYNTSNMSHLSSPMSNMRMPGGWYWGGGLHFNFKGARYGFSVVRYNMEQTASATLKNGDRREMKIVMKPINTDFDILYSLSKRVKLGMAVGYEQQHCILYSGYRYNGAFLSYGTDQPLNGIFRASDDFGITLGARADVAIIRQLRLMLRADYVGVFKGKQKEGNDYELTPWRDELYNHSTAGGTHDDGTSHLYMVEDVANANDDLVYFAGTGSNFARMFRGWRFSIGIELDLWSHSLH